MQINKTHSQISFSSREYSFYRRVSSNNLKPRGIKKAYKSSAKKEISKEEYIDQQLEIPKLTIPKDERIISRNLGIDEIMELLERTKIKIEGIILLRRKI